MTASARHPAGVDCRCCGGSGWQEAPWSGQGCCPTCESREETCSRCRGRCVEHCDCGAAATIDYGDGSVSCARCAEEDA